MSTLHIHPSDSQSPPSPLLLSPSCESILSAVDLFVHKERAALQAQIRRLQAENAELLRENGDLLLRQTILSNASPPSVVAVGDDDGDNPNEKLSSPSEQKDALVTVLLAKVHHCQRFLVKERETFALREASFDQNLKVLQRMVEQVVRTETHHHRHQGQVATAPLSAPKRIHPSNASPPPSPKRPVAENIPNDLVNRVMQLTTNLSRRAEEAKQIRILAEAKAEEIALRIASLERKSEGLSLLRAHNNQVDMELDVLKLRLKKLEAMALELVPLEDQDILLDFEAYRDDLSKVKARQKQRRKKEERWRFWGS